jgi:hypothetical protein
MKNLFEQFANSGTETTAKDLDIRLGCVELSGSVTINKGSLSYKSDFYARVYKMKYDGYVTIDDCDFDQTYEYSFAGMPIDSLNKLKESLKNSGLGTIAESLDTCWADESKAMYSAINNHPQFKEFFGGAVLWDSLSDDERTIINLEKAIENYDNTTIHSPGMNKFNITKDLDDGHGNMIKTTEMAPLETLKEKLQELKSK